MMLLLEADCNIDIEIVGDVVRITADATEYGKVRHFPHCKRKYGICSWWVDGSNERATLQAEEDLAIYNKLLDNLMKMKMSKCLS